MGFQNANSRPIQTDDIIQITTAAGKTLFYYFSELFLSTLKNSTTSVAISGETSKTVTHNLGYDPLIKILDSLGNVVNADISYTSGVSWILNTS